MHRALLPILVMILGCCAPLAADPMDAVVQVSATVTEGTAAVTLTWVAGTSGDGYDIYRRDPASTAWGSPIATLAAGATTWTDATVAIGAAYEYQLVRYSLVASTHAAISWGYVLSGVDAVTQADYRGSVVLLVDTTTYTPTNDTDLSGKILRLQQDMVADGWNVIRHDVTRTDSVPSIKALITADYAAAPSDVKMVFLFGNVPVAYSGDLAFDGHAEHQGAWPADGFYADMDGTYTDSTVNDTSSGDPRIDNVPGDGKYDQSFLTGTTFLAIGRVDLSDMWPGYSEPAVLKTYLDRDHAFRTRVWSAQQKAVAIDGFGDYAPAVQTALRSYPPLVGAANITRGGIVGGASNVSPTNWWPTMDDPALAGNPYLLAFQSGPGYSQGIINGQVASWDFTVNAATPMQSHAVFCTFFGSFFGDWGYDVALLKAPLAGTGEGLGCFWAGRPDWFMHRLGLGGNLGSVLQLSMAHSAEYQNQDAYPQAIQLSLMGDPTLRLHPLVPPGAVTSSSAQGQAQLSWTASADAHLGYLVLRAATATGPFVRLTPHPIQATTYSDTTASVGSTQYYLIKAVAIQTSPSGSYINSSLGSASVAVTIAPVSTGTTTTGTTTATSATGTTTGTATGSTGTAGTTTSASGTGTGSTAAAASASATTSSTGSGGSTAATGGSSGSSGSSGSGGCGLGGGLGMVVALLAWWRRRSAVCPAS